jgi:hypothetical protein
VIDDLVTIERADRGARRSAGVRETARGAHGDDHVVVDVELLLGKIDLEGLRRVETPMPDVPHDPHDLPPRTVDSSDLDSFSQGADASPEPVGERAIHDHDGRSLRPIDLGQVPSCDQGDLHGSKVIGAHGEAIR